MDIQSEVLLISAAQAAVRLGVSPRSVHRHFPTVRIGDRVLVRVEDIEAKIAKGYSMQSDLLILYRTAEDVTYRLRQDFEKGGQLSHITLMTSPIAGYLFEFPDRHLFLTKDDAVGLASDFVQWLKQYPPRGGGEDGEELRAWIRNYHV